MPRSPVLRDFVAHEVQKTILNVLVARFGRDAEAIGCELHPITGEERLQQLARRAAACPDLGSFRKRLGAGVRQRTVPEFAWPVLAEAVAARCRATIIQVLAGRFGREARTLRPAIKPIVDVKRLNDLVIRAAKCPDLESSRKRLES